MDPGILIFMYTLWFFIVAIMFASLEAVEQRHYRTLKREQEIFDLEKEAAESARHNAPRGFYR